MRLFQISNFLIFVKNITFTFLISFQFFFITNYSYAQETAIENFYNDYPDPYLKSLKSILDQGEISEIVIDKDKIIITQPISEETEKTLEVISQILETQSFDGSPESIEILTEALKDQGIEATPETIEIMKTVIEGGSAVSTEDKLKIISTALENKTSEDTAKTIDVIADVLENQGLDGSPESIEILTEALKDQGIEATPETIEIMRVALEDDSAATIQEKLAIISSDLNKQSLNKTADTVATIKASLKNKIFENNSKTIDVIADVLENQGLDGSPESIEILTEALKDQGIEATPETIEIMRVALEDDSAATIQEKLAIISTSLDKQSFVLDTSNNPLDIINKALNDQNQQKTKMLFEQESETLASAIDKSKNVEPPSKSLFSFEEFESVKFIEENTSSDLKNYNIIAIAMKSSPDLDLQYIVKMGDSLNDIASKFGVSVDSILEANPNINNNKLITDDIINIYSPSVIYSDKGLQDFNSNINSKGFEYGTHWVELAVETKNNKEIKDQISYYRRNFEDLFFGKTIRVRPLETGSRSRIIEVGPFSEISSAEDVVSVLNFRLQPARINKVVDPIFTTKSGDSSYNLNKYSSDIRRGKNMALLTSPSGNILQVYEGDYLGLENSRIVKILPNKIILTSQGNEINLYFSKYRRTVLETNDGFKDNILSGQNVPTMVPSKRELDTEGVDLSEEVSEYSGISSEILNAPNQAGYVPNNEVMYYNAETGTFEVNPSTISTEIYTTDENGNIVPGSSAGEVREYGDDPEVYVYDEATGTYVGYLGSWDPEPENYDDSDMEDISRLSAIKKYEYDNSDIESVDFSSILSSDPASIANYVDGENTKVAIETTDVELELNEEELKSVLNEYMEDGKDVSFLTNYGGDYDSSTGDFNFVEDDFYNFPCSYFEDPAMGEEYNCENAEWNSLAEVPDVE